MMQDELITKILTTIDIEIKTFHCGIQQKNVFQDLFYSTYR